ncbi:hypothetical protein ASD54_07490 [Rhizobium sp. Root149]|uniref:hypothetical protein n=1 Tax=Rhizobium sp. Root149 TaxID=1736473 RepID=UPI000715A1C8|nr:hypothetical protein [Rhizobium sp. Root149]KQZ55113.1 hypothetical protein ASD54_07490 [Rhizobium sp. Root149]
MIDLSAPSSPHYFTIQNQESSDPRSDGPSPVSCRLSPRLKFKFPSHHPRRKALHDALEVLREVANRDADYARNQNNEGFSKSDSSPGHMLSKAGLETALRNPQLADRILAMAGRYKRQVLRLRQMDLL